MEANTKPDGGPAFPRPAAASSITFAEPLNKAQNGMSLRDHFAGLAMQNLIPMDSDEADHKHDAPVVARMAYEYADAMIAERSKS